MIKPVKWRANLKDAMFSMYLLERDKGAAVDTEHEIETMKEYCARMVRLATQKTAGQRGKADDLDMDSVDVTMMTIVISACRLCLSGALGPMPDEIEGDFDSEELKRMRGAKGHGKNVIPL